MPTHLSLLSSCRAPSVAHSSGLPAVALLGFLLSASCFSSWGQYSVDWSTIDGGGATSTGGVYTAIGTIGQPDAGTLSGGNFTVQCGFWGIIVAVQTPGAPPLTITHTETNSVVVSWPSPSTGWSPQQNSSVDTTNWVTPPETVSDTGTNKFILVAPPTGNRFYRLTR